MINYLKIAALKYSKYLLGKKFLIICDDYSQYSIKFVKIKFCHLTGINVSLNDNSFFRNCLLGIVSKAEINDIQHYDFKTLCKKCSRLSKIDSFLHAKTNNTLFLENLHTHTVNYPVAINNVSLDTCIGFKDNDLKGVTLRASSNSYNADSSKRIICILSKNNNEETYSDICYISNIKKIFEKIPDFKKIISEELLNRLTYIVAV